VSEFKTWYFSKPLVTRTYLAICTAMTLLITLGLIGPKLLFYTFSTAILELNLWRPFTALFYMGKFSFGMIFNMYFAYIALSKVETLVFTRDKYADFLWLNVCVYLGCLVVGSIVEIYFFAEPYQMAMIYIWCKRFPHEEITLMFGFRVKSNFLPTQPATSPSSTPS
jgi:Derlin-2/3